MFRNEVVMRRTMRLVLLTLLILVSYTVAKAFPLLQEGFIDTVAGNGSATFSGDGGPATIASLQFPFGGIGVDGAGNIYIPDSGNNRIRRVDAVTGIITTVAGNGSATFSGDGGPATSASLNFPTKVVVDNNSNLFIVDLVNNRIRRVDAVTGIITTVAGNGSSTFNGDNILATDASLSSPEGAALDTDGNLFIADQGHDRVRRVDAVTGIITTVAGNGSFGFSGDGGLAIDASFKFPTDVSLDSNGNLFIADLGNKRIRRVDAVTGIITTVAGNGSSGFNGDNILATNASVAFPVGVALDSIGNIFIADGDNQRIRRVDAVTGIITTVAGSGAFGFSGDGGLAIDASLANPYGVTVDGFGNLFISDVDNNRIRRVFVGGIDGDGPIVSNLQATPNPVPINTAIALSATVDDSATGGSTIDIAEYSLDGGSLVPMAAQDGAFDEVNEDVAATVPAFSEAGLHEICVLGTDAAGNVGLEECILLAVYDPDAGFVTGGGWIWSQMGWCQLDPACAGAEGKANFGFVSKYKKGATIPTGNTEFNFKAGNMNFRSNTYEWLVVTMGGTNAQYKGSGTINGGFAPNGAPYMFMLWAKDLDSGASDTFRIRIWYENGGEIVVYDNGFDQTIGGGNIKIHTK